MARNRGKKIAKPANETKASAPPKAEPAEAGSAVSELVVNQVSTEISPEMQGELEVIAAEQQALKEERLTQKDVKELESTLEECRSKAQDIKAEVLTVLEDRKVGEKECIDIEHHIGDRLASLTSTFEVSVKECLENETPKAESPGSEPKAPIVSKEKRNSKSATPPPTGNQKAIQEKISDLNKQDTKKQSSGSKKKAIENIMKSVEGIQDPSEKVMALCKQNQELEEQLRAAQASSERWMKQFQSEQKNCNQAVLAKDKLESLCRDLHKRNNDSKQELENRRREEEERRKQISAKFQSTFSDISSLMANTQETSGKLREDNSQLAQKLRSLVNHYELWEKHSEHMLRQKSIEAELAQAKLRECQLHREKESKENQQVRTIFELTVTKLKQQLEDSITKEIALREELKIHNQKYEEFQTAFDSSNKMFASFRGSVEEMSKQTRTLERQVLEWKGRFEKAEQATARVMQEKLTSDIKAETLTRLCRSLTEKLKLNPQDVATMEGKVATEVIVEEKEKMRAELAKKEADILKQKEAILREQQELQKKAAVELEKAKLLKDNIGDMQNKATAAESTTEKPNEEAAVAAIPPEGSGDKPVPQEKPSAPKETPSAKPQPPTSTEGQNRNRQRKKDQKKK